MSDDFWTNLENEPCDSCGVVPSRHQGHGSFTCRPCYEARWCKKCGYAKSSHEKNGDCPPAELRAKWKAEVDAFFAEIEKEEGK